MREREVLYRHCTTEGRCLQVVQGDLTREAVDAIVNAANEHLAHGGGVAGAIVRAGGSSIQDESRAWVREHGPVRTGTAAITGAGNLAVRYVIHAVGPVWRGGGNREPELLSGAVRSALELADEHGLVSVSLPAISSGIFGFPKSLCAQTILAAIVEFWEDHAGACVAEVNVVNIDRITADIFREEASLRFGDSD
jgi:putative ATPase